MMQATVSKGQFGTHGQTEEALLGTEERPFDKAFSQRAAQL